MIPDDKNASKKFQELSIALEKMAADGGESSMSEYHKALLRWTRRIDQRYAWVVLTAAFIFAMGILTPYRLYGFMFAKQAMEGTYTREEASWSVSMIFTLECILGPLASILVYYISHQNSLILGAILVVLGNGVACYTQSLLVDIVFIGIVQGTGYAFALTPFMGIMNGYFVKYRSLAIGAAFCGGTIGSICFAPVMRWYLKTHDARHGYLVTFGITCLSLLVVPILKHNKRPLPPNQPLESLDSPIIDRNPPSLKALNHLSRITYQNSFRRQAAQVDTLAQEIVEREGSISSLSQIAPLEERKISTTKSLSLSRSSIDDQQNVNNEKSQVKAQSSHPPNDNLEIIKKNDDGQETIRQFRMSLIWNLLKTPAFHLIWYNEVIYFWTFSIYVLIMVDYGVDKGCTESEAGSLIIYHSIGELVGRLILAYIVDLKLISNRSATIGILLSVASLITLMTQLHGFYWLAIITLCIMALLSIFYILLNALLVDYLGEDQAILGYGIASCIGGALITVRPYAVGYYRDNFGTYEPLLLYLAGSCLTGAILWILEPFITRLFTSSKACSGNKKQETAVAIIA